MADAGIEGFYIVYVAGAESNGILMLMLSDGQIAGADPFGVVLDGSYALSEDQSQYQVRIKVVSPPGGRLIQGIDSGPSGLTYEITSALPLAPQSLDFVELSTPLGKVNARFKKLRGLHHG